jgi:hypothetical protein
MSALEKRISDALADAAARSIDIAASITETETAITAADHVALAERIKALDPAQSPDPVKARAAMEDAAFTRDRLKTLLPRLQQHFQTVVAREELATWRSRHDDVKERRDAAAAKLQEVYEPFVEQIVSVLLEIEQIDHDIRQVNATTPADGATGTHLEPVEIVARAPSGPNWSSIMNDLRLPHWAPHAGQAWPPHRPIDFAQLQISTRPPGDPRRYTARWYEVYEEEKLRASRGQVERNQAG